MYSVIHENGSETVGVLSALSAHLCMVQIDWSNGYSVLLMIASAIVTGFVGGGAAHLAKKLVDKFF